MPRQRTIDDGALLDAAEAVLREEGARALTLAAVARRAGVSKGGLQYRYPSKTALVAALLSRGFDVLEASVETAGDGDAGGPLRSYVDAMIGTRDENAAHDLALLTALYEDPRLIAALRERHRAMIDRLRASGADPDLVAVAVMATNGLWLLEAMGLEPMTDPQRETFIEALTKLSGPSR